MTRICILAGVLLCVVGLSGYVLTERVSLTALIPAIPGVLLVILGGIAASPRLRKHAMHGAVLVGLLGFLGTADGLWKGARVLAGSPMDRPAAAFSKGLTALICLLFVALCVRSFIAARRARKSAENPGG